MEEEWLNDFNKKQKKLAEDGCKKELFADRNTSLNKFYRNVVKNNRNIIEIGRENHFRAGKDGKLFFVINDIIFTDSECENRVKVGVLYGI